MSVASNKLREMLSSAPGHIENIAPNIEQIEGQVLEIQEEITAITDGICTPAESFTTDILTTQVLSAVGGDSISYGSTFGVANINWSPAGNLTDWEILDEFSAPIYSYTPGDYPNLDGFVDDFAASNDFLTRPLTDGASYGLQPMKSSLEFAQSILQENSNQATSFVDILNKYATGGIYT